MRGWAQISVAFPLKVGSFLAREYNFKQKRGYVPTRNSSPVFLTTNTPANACKLIHNYDQ